MTIVNTKVDTKVRTLTKVTQGSLLNHFLTFNCEENQTVVGQINEPAATSFTIINGDDTFEIDNSGNISFLVAPDYETQNLYSLIVRSNRNRRYTITVNVTDVLSDFALLSDTELLTSTAV